MSIAETHVAVDCLCAVCHSVWPCAVWVEEREAWDAEMGPTCDSCGRWLIRHPWMWCQKRLDHSCHCGECEAAVRAAEETGGTRWGNVNAPEQ